MNPPEPRYRSLDLWDLVIIAELLGQGTPGEEVFRVHAQGQTPRPHGVENGSVG